MESRLVIKVLCFLFLSWIGIAAALEEDGSRNVEPSVVSVDISKLGAPEYLSPHLVELQNFVRSYLPNNLRLISIIEAFREIINGVRYDLLIKALDSQDTEVVCHLVIKEKWEFSVIEHTNCSSYYKDSDPYISQYETRTINRHRDNSDRPLNLRDVEHQIVPKYKYENSDAEISDVGEEGSADNDEKLSDAAKDALSEIFGDIPDSNYIQKSPNEKIRSGKSSEESPPNRRKRAAIENGNTKLRYSLSSKIPFFSQSNLLDKAEHLFSKYKLKFNKNYEATELKERFKIFRNNLALIDELNRNEQGTAKYGITDFADLTPEEYKQRTGLLYREYSENNIKNPLAEIPDFKLPAQFDWRKRGAISSVKNQGSCGSCWAFSVTGNIEGLHAIKTGNLEEYSEQELLDCDTVDKACMGGLPDDAYKAIEQIGGLELESDYPYKAKKDQCAFNENKVRVKLSGAVDLPKNETAMALWLVANGPISIGINANAMQFYRGGISHPWKLLCRAGGIDHGVLIVGFGVRNYPKFNKILPYWIVKNSWGDKWGEQGYYRVFRGDNTCGINSMASSAVLK